MQSISKSVALLIAGALISVLTSLYIHPLMEYWLLYLLILIILLLYGFSIISPLDWISMLRRKFLHPKVGILDDMGWDPKNEQIYTKTNVSPNDWKKWIEKFAKDNGIRINVEFINVTKRFDSYVAIINPYGGVYPEHDLKNFETMNKILNYVNNEGTFINIADIPCYYAYNPLLKRRLDITPPIYGIDKKPNGKILMIPVRPFELTPLMEKLGLRVLNVEEAVQQSKNGHKRKVDGALNPKRSEIFGAKNNCGTASEVKEEKYYQNIVSIPCTWNVEFEEEFSKILKKGEEIAVHRVVVVERNVEPIIKSERRKGTEITPLFLAHYGDGKLIISLIFEDFPGNNKMKEALAKIIVKIIGEKKGLFAVLYGCITHFLQVRYELLKKFIRALLQCNNQ